MPAVRRFNEQFYIYDTKHRFGDYVVIDESRKKSNGSTVSVKKRGGWASAWKDAQVLAGWCKAPAAKQPAEPLGRALTKEDE